MRIFEPKRNKYRKQYKYSKNECDFCADEILRDQGVSSLETEYWRVLASKYPYLDGNLMLIPKRHVSDVDDLTAEEWADFKILVKRVKQILGKIFETDSFNLGLNIGENSGASIKHLHWQIVPRPKKLNSNSYNIFNDFYFVTLDYKELIKMIEEDL